MQDLKKVLKTTESYIRVLNKYGISTLKDFLLYFPRTYEDRTNLKYIYDLIFIQPKTASVKGQVLEKKYYRTRKNFYLIKCEDEKKNKFYVSFFDSGYGASRLKVGNWYIFSGKIKISGKSVTFIHPDISEAEEVEEQEGVKSYGLIYPIYSELGGIKSSWFAKKMYLAIKYVDEIFDEYLPEDFLSEFGLIDVKNMIKNMHFPQSQELLLKSKERYFFDKLLRIQLHSKLEKKDYQKEIPVNKEISWDVVKEFVSKLPFELTMAQKKVIKEIIEDIHSGKTMIRLLQGDVGSGKTIVAATIFYYIHKVFNGQSVLLAPLEVLATQHFEKLSKLFLPLGINIGLLKGSLTPKQKLEIKDKIKNGVIDIIIGTHAIIQDDVEFDNLQFAVIDEQHKFGVRQRSFLKAKGSPHILQMSATPIPRSMALAFFGEFDVSIIDELPSGRKKIKTKVISKNQFLKLRDWLIQKVNLGEQVYIVTPLIEESEKMEEVSAATKEYENIKEFLYEIRDYIGLLHGKMSAKEKNEIMKKFKEGEIKVLVSTTVIEVGVDVPQATVMIIKNAERFGLSQLHQLRGRIGRSDLQSYCFLETSKTSGPTYKRLKIMEEVSDGFKLAEIDLKYRGAGEILGTRQSGESDIPVEILSNIKFIKRVSEAAEWLLQKYNNLEKLPILKNYLENKLDNLLI